MAWFIKSLLDAAICQQSVIFHRVPHFRRRLGLDLVSRTSSELAEIHRTRGFVKNLAFHVHLLILVGLLMRVDEIPMFQLLKCDDLLHFSVSYHNKLNIFLF